MEEVVALVLGLAREVELGGEHGTALGLHLHVDVPGPAGIHRRHDRLEPVRPGGVGEQVAAQPVPLVVVVTVVVGVPEVQQGARGRPARGRQDYSRDDDLGSAVDVGEEAGLSGESGVKNGPSVWFGVGSSPSVHAGVGANVVAVAASVDPESSTSTPRRGRCPRRRCTRPLRRARMRAHRRGAPGARALRPRGAPVVVAPSCSSSVGPGPDESIPPSPPWKSPGIGSESPPTATDPRFRPTRRPVRR